jgi:hypothetical protein
LLLPLATGVPDAPAAGQGMPAAQIKTVGGGQ